jgi:hypothetical protein
MMECIFSLLSAYSSIVHIFLCLRLYERLDLNINTITWMLSNIQNVYCTSHYFLLIVTLLEHVHFCGMSLVMNFDPCRVVKGELFLHHDVVSLFMSVSRELAAYIMRVVQYCIVAYHSNLACCHLLIRKVQNANLYTT